MTNWPERIEKGFFLAKQGLKQREYEKRPDLGAAYLTNAIIEFEQVRDEWEKEAMREKKGVMPGGDS